MCIKKIPTFGVCKHSGANNPDITYIDTDGCPTKDCEHPREQTEYRSDEKCFDCIGVEPFQRRRDGPSVFFKHCFQSEICDHEFEYFVTEIERDPFEPEVVLVTPIPNDICPDCQANGYDRKPGGTNYPPKTASVIPPDYENLPRASMATIMPGASMKPEPSRVSIAIDNPRAREALQAKALTRAMELATVQPHGSTATRVSKIWSTSIAPSYQTSYDPPPDPTAYKPTVHGPPSQAPKANTTKPALTAADYLKRGAPKNVAASAFYDNPDGAEARSNIAQASTATRGIPRPPHFQSRISSPPTDAPTLEPEEQIGGGALFPKAVRPQSSTARPGASAQRPIERPLSASSRPSEAAVPTPSKQWASTCQPVNTARHGRKGKGTGEASTIPEEEE